MLNTNHNIMEAQKGMVHFFIKQQMIHFVQGENHIQIDLCMQVYMFKIRAPQIHA